MNLIARVRASLPLVSILLGAFALRMWDIHGDFPYLYHPDEPSVVRSALGFRYDSFNPGHFDWPHFHFYLVYGVFEVFIGARGVLFHVGLRPLSEQLFPLLWDDGLVFYLVARCITVVFGVSTVFLTYYCGKLLTGSIRGGLVAALFLAVSPLHVMESRVATIDVPMAFWLTVAFSLLLRGVQEVRPRFVSFAAFWGGIAMSTKYNAGAFLIPLGVALLQLRASLSTRGWAWVARFSVLCVMLFGGAFYLGTPFALIDWRTFLSTDDFTGALWQFTREGNATGLSFSERVLLRYPESAAVLGGSMYLLLALVGGSLVIFRNRLREGYSLAMFALAYFAYALQLSYYQPHFLIPLTPVLAVLAALFVRVMVNCFPLRVRIFLIFGFLLPALYRTAIDARVVAAMDTRTQALEWLHQSIPRDVPLLHVGEYPPALETEDAFGNRYDVTPYRVLERSLGHPPASWEDVSAQGYGYLVLSAYDLEVQKSRVREGFQKGNAVIQLVVHAGMQPVKTFTPHNQPGPSIEIYQLP